MLNFAHQWLFLLLMMTDADVVDDKSYLVIEVKEVKEVMACEVVVDDGWWWWWYMDLHYRGILVSR